MNRAQVRNRKRGELPRQKRERMSFNLETHNYIMMSIFILNVYMLVTMM